MKNSNRKKKSYSLKSRKNKRLGNKKQFRSRKDFKNKTKKIKKYKKSKIFYGGGNSHLFNISNYLKDYITKNYLLNYGKTLSVYNSSVKLIERDEVTGVLYYLCVSRVNYFVKKNSSGQDALLSDDDINNLYLFFKNKITFEPADNNPDKEDNYVDYPGSIFNKWNTPYGFWGAHHPNFIMADKTIASIIKCTYKGDDSKDLFPFMFEYIEDAVFLLSAAPIDSRAVNIFNNIKIPRGDDIEWSVNSFYITGNRNPFHLAEHPTTASIKLKKGLQLKIPDDSIIRGFDSTNNKYLTIDEDAANLGSHGNPRKQALNMYEVIPENDVRQHIIYPESSDKLFNGDLTVDYQKTNNIGWKQTVSRIQVIRQYSKTPFGRLPGEDLFAFSFPYQTGIDPSERNPFIHKEICNQESLANSISWDIKLEKNYILHYFDTDDERRKYCSKKCMLLQYSLCGKISETEKSSMTFYYKEFDSSIDTTNINSILDGKQFETELDNSWKIYQLPAASNNQYFSIVENHFKDANMKISGSTPFVEFPQSLVAVGHMKVDIFKYMNIKIEIAIKELINRNDVTELGIEEWQAIVNYYSGNFFQYKKSSGRGPDDKLFRFGMKILEKMNNIFNDKTHGINGDRKYLQKINNIKDQFWSTSGSLPSYLKYPNMINFMDAYCKCIHKNESTPDSYVTIRNMHPDVIYLMFFYELDKSSLLLSGVSQFFIFAPNNNCSFLNFPIGLTVGDNKYKDGYFLLSYGEGDHDSYLVPLKMKDIFNRMSLSVKFEIFDNLSITNVYGDDL